MRQTGKYSKEFTDEMTRRIAVILVEEQAVRSLFSDKDE